MVKRMVTLVHEPKPADRPSLTFDEVTSIVSRGVQYLDGEIPGAIDDTVRLAKEILTVLCSDVDGVTGGFGVGFPFHSVDREGNVARNPEFSDYNQRLLAKIALSAGESPSPTWDCSGLFGSDRHTTSDCKKCPITTLKPRDVLKALPDIDLFVIATDNDQSTRDQIQTVANQGGFYPKSN